ncbi:unnamed protein product [Rodentolepis nana]|uniref:Uncharacterized protein n=1 Tax=Rodentolepis nana TaxID=102285 RepID=A0A0R3TNC1_RODNA|nr:unnamed protein product [Rodentolepis nana]
MFLNPQITRATIPPGSLLITSQANLLSLFAIREFQHNRFQDQYLHKQVHSKENEPKINNITIGAVTLSELKMMSNSQTFSTVRSMSEVFEHYWREDLGHILILRHGGGDGNDGDSRTAKKPGEKSRGNGKVIARENRRVSNLIVPKMQFSHHLAPTPFPGLPISNSSLIRRSSSIHLLQSTISWPPALGSDVGCR